MVNRWARCPDDHIWNITIGGVLLRVTDLPPHALVLVVDDDVLERMGASYMFLDAGYRVLEAGDADEALRFFEADAHIRLLFTDVSMPGSINGSDLACQVADRWPRVGIIVTSGRPRPGNLPTGTRFLGKPYDPTAVIRQAGDMTVPLA
jgi:two-component system, response regulator PdtaR